MDPERTSVFDFDGTLIHGDSVAGFAVAHVLGRPLRLLFVLPLLPVALALLPFRRTITAGVNLCWWLLTWGSRTRPFATAMRRYARTTLVRRGNEVTLGELAASLSRGDNVVVATAAPALLVHELLRARGLAGVRVVGSRVRRRFGGLVAHPHCIGPMKVHELARRFGLSRWAAAYTDSGLDLPLLQRASAVTLVEPSQRTLRLVERALPKNVPVRVVRARS